MGRWEFTTYNRERSMILWIGSVPVVFALVSLLMAVPISAEVS